jgi:hypothetical protein
MPNDLTPAETAVADSLHRVYRDATDCVFTHPLGSEDFYDEARAVVAAVHDLIAAETLDRFADKLDALPPGGEALSGPYWYRDGLRDAASMARLDAESSRILSRPTSEEH